MHTSELRIEELRRTIAAHDGDNVAGATFRGEVDALIGEFYDDIGRITTVSAGSLFALVVIKTLYVDRRSTDAAVVEYLGAMLTRHLFSRELFPVVRDGRPAPMYLSDLIELTRGAGSAQNLFEPYRRFADNALFIAGMLPRSIRRPRRGGMMAGAGAGFVDTAYYVSMGKTYYRKAAGHELAGETNQRETLEKLSRYFEVYMEALNEASENFILGLDMKIIADKMLDSYNRYRTTGEEQYLENACKFAALLRVDSGSFPALFSRRAAASAPSAHA